MLRLTETDAYICGPETVLHDVLSRINMTSPLLCQIVVDDDRRVVGTVTDGDIRRGLLKGMTLESPVKECMYTAFKYAVTTDPRSIPAQLYDKGWPVSFLPVLDGESHLIEIVAPDQPLESGIDRALIMAGGFGKRLGSMTRDLPKPLVKVAGRPILDHVLYALENAGILKIEIAVHYRADQIRSFVQQRPNVAEISLIEETEPLGTAGAFGLIPSHPEEPMLVINADVVTDVDYSALHQFYNNHDYDAVLCVSPYSVDIPFGVVDFDETGAFRTIHEKPKITRHISAGVYLLAPEVFGLVGQHEKVDMPDVLKRAHAKGMKIGIFPIHEYWIDLGRPHDIQSFNEEH